MRDLARDPDLAQQAGQSVFVLFQRCGQHLERHRLVELQVIGPVHLAHAAAAEETDDAITPGEDRARQEATSFELGLARPGRLADGHLQRRGVPTTPDAIVSRRERLAEQADVLVVSDPARARRALHRDATAASAGDPTGARNGRWGCREGESAMFEALPVGRIGTLSRSASRGCGDAPRFGRREPLSESALRESLRRQGSPPLPIQRRAGDTPQKLSGSRGSGGRSGSKHSSVNGIRASFRSVSGLARPSSSQAAPQHTP